MLIAELFDPAELAPVLATVPDSAFEAGFKVLADGVYSAVPVKAFEPAEEDPEAEKEVEAPVPLVPEDALAMM